MVEGQNNEQKADRALESFEGIRRAEPAPWFFTRVQSRLNREEKTPLFKLGSYLSRPIVAIASVCLVLLVNGYFLTQQKVSKNSTAQVEQTLLSENESIIATNSSYDYETLSLP